jgi:RNA polymerase sigma-70 factor (sigma-E family)
MRERAWLMDTREVVDAAEPRPGSLEELYVRHVPEATRLAFLLTRDAVLAEDIGQEAFIKVAGRLRHLRAPDAFGSYLRRTVVNLCISHHRREKVARVYAERERARFAHREPATGLPDVETHDELRTALAKLPDRQRAAVVLRFYADLPEEAIAEALGCTIGAARNLVFRGMQTLRSRIEGEKQ